MTIKGIFAIMGVFILGTSGWMMLGAANEVRTYRMETLLDHAVGSIWGEAIAQRAPTLSIRTPGTRSARPLFPSANDIHVVLNLEQRRKGLRWYPTYSVDFDAQYSISNANSVAQDVRLHFPFPSATATYDNVSLELDGTRIDTVINAEQGIREIIPLAASETRKIRIRYRSRGLHAWRYQLTPDGGRVQQLRLQINTNFKAVDFPTDSLAPMSKKATKSGIEMVWDADDLITRQAVAIQMPEKLNPGPLAARMSFFAPFCLLFFFVLIAAIGIVKNIRIHPMHYLFVTGGFFAFHLFFAYLIDVINVHVAFALTSLVSTTLVITYLRAALGPTFPWQWAVAGQLFYLVLFSYSFFIDGMTGLTITVGSILTLALLMRFTAKTDWHKVFSPSVTPKAASPSSG